MRPFDTLAERRKEEELKSISCRRERVFDEAKCKNDNEAAVDAVPLVRPEQRLLHLCACASHDDDNAPPPAPLSEVMIRATDVFYPFTKPFFSLCPLSPFSADVNIKRWTEDVSLVNGRVIVLNLLLSPSL